MEKFLLSLLDSIPLIFPDDLCGAKLGRAAGIYVVIVERFDGSHFEVLVSPSDSRPTTMRRIIIHCERKHRQFDL